MQILSKLGSQMLGNSLVVVAVAYQLSFTSSLFGSLSASAWLFPPSSAIPYRTALGEQSSESPVLFSISGIAVPWRYWEGKLERKSCFCPGSSKWEMLSGGYTTWHTQPRGQWAEAAEEMDPS